MGIKLNLIRTFTEFKQNSPEFILKQTTLTERNTNELNYN